MQRQRPDVPLSALLTDRVASARHLPSVLAWRLWQLLHQPPQQETQPEEPPSQHAQLKHVEDTDDWHQHLSAVRAWVGQLPSARP